MTDALSWLAWFGLVTFAVWVCALALVALLAGIVGDE